MWPSDPPRVRFRNPLDAAVTLPKRIRAEEVQSISLSVRKWLGRKSGSRGGRDTLRTKLAMRKDVAHEYTLSLRTG